MGEAEASVRWSTYEHAPVGSIESGVRPSLNDQHMLMRSPLSARPGPLPPWAAREEPRRSNRTKLWQDPTRRVRAPTLVTSRGRESSRVRRARPFRACGAESRGAAAPVGVPARPQVPVAHWIKHSEAGSRTSGFLLTCGCEWHLPTKGRLRAAFFLRTGRQLTPAPIPGS